VLLKIAFPPMNIPATPEWSETLDGKLRSLTELVRPFFQEATTTCLVKAFTGSQLKGAVRILSDGRRPTRRTRST